MSIDYDKLEQKLREKLDFETVEADAGINLHDIITSNIIKITRKMLEEYDKAKGAE